MKMNLLILTAAFALVSLQTPRLMALPTNDELKIGVTQEFESLNPLIMTMVASNYMNYLVSRQPVILTPDGKWAAQMVKSIPSLENKQAKLVTNPDGTKGIVSTWEILEKAKWGDGVPVTCADMKFTWEAGLNTNISVGNREGYENIRSITWEEKNPKKCEVTFKKAKWDFSRNLFPFLASHIESKVMEKFGNKKEGYDQNSEYNKNPTNPGLYNGPYIISEMRLGSHITFVPNPHFYGKQPTIKKVIFKLIPNTGTLEANLRSGTIDMVSPLGFAFDQAVAFEKKVKADSLPFRVLFKEGITYEHIDFDLENPILKDVKVRQAIIYAINREEITKSLFEGKQKPALHNINPLDVNYTADPKMIKVYNYSKREAVKLLDEAGWKAGPDGIRSKDGKKLSLQFMTTAGNKTRETVQTMIQSQLKSVGVEVIIKNEPARVFFGETMNKRKFGGMAMYAWSSFPEQTPRSTFHSSMIQTEKNGWSGQNNMAWSNPKVDKLVDRFEEEFNAGKRKQIMHELLAEYTKDAPVIPLYYRSENASVPTNLTNYRLSGHLFYETNEIENWSLDTKLK
ncbi:MAG: peptide ABC transporter substrate-binding protein [Pseudobdellovibrionaceae bacterium]